MRQLSDEGTSKVYGWEDVVSPEVDAAFRKTLAGLRELRDVTFPRSIRPPVTTKVNQPPMLMVLGDGSREASCALAYLRWERPDGSGICRLVSGKTRVAPKVKITIPRVELVGALMIVRLAQKVLESLGIEVGEVKYFTDSSSVLGMLKRESGDFLEFVGTRVAEIKSKTNTDTQWFWIPGELNMADLGTRSDASPEVMGQGSDYQDGKPWMRLPVSQWPTKLNFMAPPEEECRKGVTQASCNLTQVDSEGRLQYPVRASTRQKLIRIYALVMLFAARCRRQRDALAPRSLMKGSGLPTVQIGRAWMFAANAFLVEDAQRNLKVEQLKSLAPTRIVKRMVFGPPRKWWVMGGRMEKHLKVAYDTEERPLLPSRHPYSRLLLAEVHAIDHGGIDAMMR